MLTPLGLRKRSMSVGGKVPDIGIGIDIGIGLDKDIGIDLGDVHK